MLWHGGRGLPSRGSGPARVGWHSTHASASRSSGSGPAARSDGPGCAGAVRRGAARGGVRPSAARAGHPGGWRPLARGGPAGRPHRRGRRALAAARRVRSELGGPAWGVARQRARARATFGADADRMLFTGDAAGAGRRPSWPTAGPPVAGRRCHTGVRRPPGCAAAPSERAGPGRRRGPRRRPRPGGPRAHRAQRRRARLLTARCATPTSSSGGRRRDGQVAGCAAAVLDPAGGRVGVAC